VTAVKSEKGQVRGIQSIEIGYRVLLAIQAGPKEVILRDIASRAKLTASAAHNYLVSLVRTGLVETDQRGSYRLGPSAVALGLTALRHVTPYDVVHAEAIRLHEIIGCGIAILTWSDDGPIIIFKREGVQRGPYVLRNGHVPILTTGGGNVFIAYLAEKLTKPFVQAEMRLKGKPAREYQNVRAQIRDSVIACGYSARRLETLPGYGALSAPVWDLNDDVVYALTLTGPAEQLDFESGGSQVPLLLESTCRASMQLGADAKHWSAVFAK
jgi:DNA-binding IclR family transcriptional regulator